MLRRRGRLPDPFEQVRAIDLVIVPLRRLIGQRESDPSSRDGRLSGPRRSSAWSVRGGRQELALAPNSPDQALLVGAQLPRNVPVHHDLDPREHTRTRPSIPSGRKWFVSLVGRRGLLLHAESRPRRVGGAPTMGPGAGRPPPVHPSPHSVCGRRTCCRRRLPIAYAEHTSSNTAPSPWTSTTALVAPEPTP